MSSLIEQLTESAKDLLYPSESDYPLEPFVWECGGPVEIKPQEKPSAKDLETKDKPPPNTASPSPEVVTAVTVNEVLRFGKHDANAQIEEISLEVFFSRVTMIEDWFGDEEKETAQKFSELQKLLEDNLKEIKVFRVGEVEIDVYVVGVDADGNLAGVKTMVVET
jgi:hypothetical protein